MHLFPSVHTLTNLKLVLEGRAQQFKLLDVLRLINADAMPQLTSLYLNWCDLEPPSDDELPAAIAVLECMPLTRLDYINPFGCGFELLHHLPHLSVCTLGGPGGECCAESVAAAPNLTDLTCCLPGNGIASIAEEWWHRCGCPPLQYAGFVDEHKWQQHLAKRDDRRSTALLAGKASPVIRVLRCRIEADMYQMSAISFPYLAHLPHLRELECCLHANDVRTLGLLPQLEKLRVWLTELGVCPWSNATVRTLGELPLHHLHSLRLEGDDERIHLKEEENPPFPCQKDRAPDFAAAALSPNSIAQTCFSFVCLSVLSWQGTADLAAVPLSP
jgi:hypothetical protein